MSFVFANCNKGLQKVNYKKPEKVALFFTKAIASLDIANAKRAATENTQEVLHLLEVLLESMPEEEKKRLISEAQINMATLRKVKCETIDDVAKCRICCDQEGLEEVEPLILHKIGKQWLVEMKKANLE